jgi:hypothetical protein
MWGEVVMRRVFGREGSRADRKAGTGAEMSELSVSRAWFLIALAGQALINKV